MIAPTNVCARTSSTTYSDTIPTKPKFNPGLCDYEAFTSYLTAPRFGFLFAASVLQKKAKPDLVWLFDTTVQLGSDHICWDRGRYGIIFP